MLPPFLYQSGRSDHPPCGGDELNPQDQLVVLLAIVDSALDILNVDVTSDGEEGEEDLKEACARRLGHGLERQ